MVIGISSLALALALAIIGPFTFWKWQNPWDFYIPIVLFIAGYIATIILWWLFCDCSGRIIEKKKNYTKINKLSRFILTDAERYICNHALVKVTMTGKHLVPKNERFLFVCNHISRFDPMIAGAYLPKYDIGFITKPGNYRIPIAKHLMPSLFFQQIVREDPIQSLGVMKNSVDLITNKVTSIGVYPEGTRHKDAALGEFHEGVFNICLKAKCPLVVATLKDANKIAKNFPFHITRVKFDIISVIPYEQLEGKTAKAVSDEVKTLMERNLME